MAGNGGIIGPINVTSRGKNTVTSKTSSSPSAASDLTLFVSYEVINDA